MYNRTIKKILGALVVIILGVAICVMFRLEKREENNRQNFYMNTLDYIPSIICWGDSLTQGYGGNGVSYCSVLKELGQQYIEGIDVLNMGVYGETSITIAGRAGAIPYVLSADIVLSEECKPVNIEFISKDGKNVDPLKHGNAGLEYVKIGDIKGTLSYDEDKGYSFTREKPGSDIILKAGTEIITSAYENSRDGIFVIFIGTNGGWDSYEDLYKQQMAIADLQNKAKGRYIIVGLTTGDGSSNKELDDYMSKKHGKRYLNLRESLCADGLSINNMQPTNEDLSAIESGIVPPSLMNPDGLHFNPEGYTAVGHIIMRKINALHYFSYDISVK